MTRPTPKRIEEIRRELKKLNVGIFEIHPIIEDLLAEIDALRADYEEMKQFMYKEENNGIQFKKERDALKAEVTEWKAKYIDARKSGYAEGLEKCDELKKVLKEVRAAVDGGECREDEDCDHCVIIHHMIDPALKDGKEGA